MGRADYEIRIGCSGWHYDHWRGRFYPEKLPRSQWLQFYAQTFNTVEINNTFYQLPKETSVEAWRRRSPEDFVYAVKASRFITHIKKLKDSAESLGRFLQTARILKEKLGPVLFQLPPSFKKDLNLLEGFLAILPKDLAAVFEFRNDSWFSEETFDLLDRFGFGFCIHDMPSVPSPRVVTGDIIYVRFHGSTAKYAGYYSETELCDWADWLKSNIQKVSHAYLYFNNDANANAVNNAITLKQYFQ